MLKRDDAGTLSQKRKDGKKAEKELLDHLNDLTIGCHDVYDRTKLFPPTTLVWENGGYKERPEDIVRERGQKEKDFVEELKLERSDFLENHFVRD